MKEWDQFLQKMEQELGSAPIKKWIPTLEKFDAANIYLKADSFQIAWFEEHIRPRIKAFVNENGRPIKVHFSAQETKSPKPPENTPLSFHPNPIDPEMSFDHFIPSESNQIAYQVLQDPTAFNPIFLFGKPGVGKTHLLMATALKLQAQGKRVMYIKAENFTGHVVQAIRLGQMQEFRKVSRDIDALLIDNIDIFSRKWATQEEFFHTFNTLHMSNRLIVLSANVSPSKLNEIEPRLISRFEWGISLEIGHGETEAILKKKATLWNVDLKEEMLHFILSSFSKNPILALQALVFRSKGPLPPVEVAKKMLKDLLEKESENALTPEKIVKQLAAHLGITKEDILGKSQVRNIALARQLAMYHCRKTLKLPFQEIGRLFQRDHSTVMSSVKQIEKGVGEKKIDPLESALQ